MMSRLGRLTVYVAGIEAVLLLAARLLRLMKAPSADSIGVWITLVGFILAVFLLILTFRWIRNVLMWQLRNRLIVTYTFIGVIPVVLLLAMALIAGYLFAGQFANFVVTSDIRSQAQALQAANATVAATIINRLNEGSTAENAFKDVKLEVLQKAVPVPKDAQAEGSSIVVSVEREGKVVSNVVPSSARLLTVPAAIKGNQFSGLVGHQERLFVRAVTRAEAGPYKVTVISSLPAGREFLARLAEDLGEVTVYPPDTRSDAAEPGMTVRNGKIQPYSGGDEKKRSAGASGNELNQVVIGSGRQDATTVRTRGEISAGKLPPQTRWWDREVVFGTLYPVTDWQNGGENLALISIITRPSLLYDRLFLAVGKFAGLVMVLLGGVAIFFALIELFALIIGVRLSRTMTRSVANLYEATQNVERGELTHRISVTGRDQLAALETSFNSMTESLERLIAEQKEKQRMESELAIAKEVQAQLFPHAATELKTLDIHGVCRPARTVSGDYYDFLPIGHEKVGLAVGDISGKGISAALLMATIHSAVRVYELGRLPMSEEMVAAGAATISVAAGSTSLMPAEIVQSPAQVLCLLNRHLYHSTPAEKYATMFFGLWDGNRRRLTYSNGGHLPPFIIGHDGSFRKLETGGTVVGLFDDISYDEASVELRPGDLFVAYSDGLTEPENEFGEFGEARLIELIRENRNLPLARISENITAAVMDWIGANEQPDDVTLVLARAR
jgi:sigma-B regulation protein RsbU (phosphoserine phosphatase)